MSTVIDPYQVLRINRGAREEEIRFALLYKIKKFHPEANPSQGDIAIIT